VRRDSVALQGRGMIGLGSCPMPMPRTRSDIRSRTDPRRFGTVRLECSVVLSRPGLPRFGKAGKQGHSFRRGPSPAGHSPLRKECPLFSCFTGVALHERDRGAICAGESERPVSPRSTPVLRRPTWAGKNDRTLPTEAAPISPVVVAVAWVGTRHRDVARGDGAAVSLVGATSLGGFGRVLSAGPCRTPQRERRIEATPCYPLGRRKWPSIPFAQGDAESSFLKLLFEAR